MTTQRTIALMLALGFAALIASPVSADTTLDFSTFANGESVEGDTVGDVTISSSASTFYSPGGGHLGAAIFNSDPAGPNSGGGDSDLLVGLGNILILQSTDSPSKTGDIFDTPNDEADGGKLIFDFASPVSLLSIDLVDIDGNGPAKVTMIDGEGDKRTYTAAPNWTFDIDASGPDGYDTLDLTTTAAQLGEGGAFATAIEDIGFDSIGVVRLEVDFSGSAGVDNLTYVPAPGAALLAMMGFGVIGSIKRRMS